MAFLNNKTILYVAICIVLVIILAYLGRSQEMELLSGFWRADADFCNQANLTSFILYIGDGMTKKRGYLLITNHDGIVINSAVDLEISNILCIRPYIRDEINLNVNFKWLCGDDDYEAIFPSMQNIKYNPKKGKIILMDQETVYAVLYKDNIMTDISAVKKELADD